MSDLTKALWSSVVRLRTLVEPMDDSELEQQAYPKEWTVADVLSHVGSGAVIMQRRIDDELADRPTPDDFTPGVWAEWNAKDLRSKADGALVADRALLERIEALSDEERSRFRTSMGPLTLDFDFFVGMRLNEHALHTWDIEVVDEPSAALPEEVAAQIVDRLDLIARYTGRPTGADRTVVVRTAAPERGFTITLSPDKVEFVPGAVGGGIEPTLELPAEALIRLIYGRLDSAHTPSFVGAEDALDDLRRTFPGP